MNNYNQSPGNYGVNVDSQTFGMQNVTKNEFMIKTFGWMGAGLGLTFIISMLVATSQVLFSAVYSIFLPLTIAELIIVFVLSARVQKLSVGIARTLFFVYAALNGAVMSFYFVAYEFSSLFFAFLSAAVYFGLLAAYGAKTKKDLSSWGPKLMIGLIALIVCSFIGMFFGFNFVTNLLYCGVGLVIFMLLTAYDTQKLYSYYNYYSGDSEMLKKASIFGALSLYLDFINIFLMLVRLFGRRK